MSASITTPSGIRQWIPYEDAPRYYQQRVYRHDKGWVHPTFPRGYKVLRAWVGPDSGLIYMALGKPGAGWHHSNVERVIAEPVDKVKAWCRIPRWMEEQSKWVIDTTDERRELAAAARGNWRSILPKPEPESKLRWFSDGLDTWTDLYPKPEPEPLTRGRTVNFKVMSDPRELHASLVAASAAATETVWSTDTSNPEPAPAEQPVSAELQRIVAELNGLRRRPYEQLSTTAHFHISVAMNRIRKAIEAQGEHEQKSKS
jgi:hypothetical protein